MADSREFKGGYTKTRALTEGYVRKGGINSPTSQVQVRPPAPAPMRPASTPSSAEPKGGSAKG